MYTCIICEYRVDIDHSCATGYEKRSLWVAWIFAESHLFVQIQPNVLKPRPWPIGFEKQSVIVL